MCILICVGVCCNNPQRVLRLAELEGFAALIYADFGNGLDDA